MICSASSLETVIDLNELSVPHSMTDMTEHKTTSRVTLLLIDFICPLLCTFEFFDNHTILHALSKIHINNNLFHKLLLILYNIYKKQAINFYIIENFAQDIIIIKTQKVDRHFLSL